MPHATLATLSAMMGFSPPQRITICETLNIGIPPIAGPCGSVCLRSHRRDTRRLDWGATFGTGYNQARSTIEGNALGSTFWSAKFLATIAISLSGIPDGIFASSLAVGAGLGAWLGSLAGTDRSGLAAVLGMAGYFAGVVQAPMTAFVIILEMTGNDANVIPLMVAAAIGFGTSKLVAPEPLHHALVNGFIQDARDRIQSSNATSAKP